MGLRKKKVKKEVEVVKEVVPATSFDLPGGIVLSRIAITRDGEKLTPTQAYNALIGWAKSNLV